MADVGGLVCELLELCGVLGVEERGGLLEREAFGLDDEEVDVCGLEREPAAVHNLYSTPGEGEQPSASVSIRTGQGQQQGKGQHTRKERCKRHPRSTSS